MTEERYEQLTKSHAEALDRLTGQETAAKRQRNYLMITALTAVIGGGGGATALIRNDDENVKTVVATHVAVYEDWRPDVDAMQDQLMNLRDAMIRLQVTVEGLSDKHRGGRSGELRARMDEVEGLLSEIGGRRKPRAKPAPERVNRLKGELFAD